MIGYTTWLLFVFSSKHIHDTPAFRRNSVVVCCISSSSRASIQRIVKKLKFIPALVSIHAGVQPDSFGRTIPHTDSALIPRLST